MKATAVRGLAVVDIDSAQKIGTIEDVLLNVFTGKIEAFAVKGLRNGEDVLVMAAQAQKLGQDALTFQGKNGTTKWDKEAQKRGAVLVDAAGATRLTSLLNHYKMVSQGGALLGEVKDVQFDPSQMVITGYEVSEGGLFAKTRTFRTDPAIRFGENLAVVPEGIVPTT